MNVVVTGGAGFIGSNISRELLRRNHRVTIIDNLATGRLVNISEFRKQIRFVHGDIRHLDLLQRVFRKADYVLHQAALPSVPRSINNPLASHETNVNGTLNVLLAARDQKIRRVVLASSSSVYGNRHKDGITNLKHKTETMKPQPLAPYAVNKLIGELYAKVFGHIYKVPTVCLRYFNVFGHNQDPQSQYAAVIPRFITGMLKNQRPIIYGDGLQSRDFTYIDNVVQANILGMTSGAVREGESINIACGQSISLLHLVASINTILKKKIKPKFEPTRPGDVKHSLADIRKAKRLIGYAPTVLFADGLRRTVEWYREHETN